MKKENSKLRVGALWRWDGALCYFLALQAVIIPGVAAGQSIVPDGRTRTAVTTRGAVTDVTTATVRGANAFNSFATFSVGQGATANLHLPSGTANLVNLVRDARTDIHGVVNSIRDGRIGGNVWFANPHGFVVGPAGVVNVGSLHVATPTQAFVDGFFLSPGNPDDAAVAQLLAGTAPRNGSGLISIQGQVNAIEGVSLAAGAINAGGRIYSGARFIGGAPDFTDVVNANGLDSATTVVVSEGRVRIVADNDVTVSGTIAAPGSPGVKGGDVAIRAGGNVALEPGASVVARGNGTNSPGGTVNIFANGDAVMRAGAIVDASAGASGDGGTIEFSARRGVELAGGEFRAAATQGRRGTVLIDPATVTVSADFYSGGADHSIVADDRVTVNSGVTISMRNVAGGAGANQESAASAGDSGNLTLAAAAIELKPGSKLLAHADNGFAGGTVTLNASSEPAVSILGYREAAASVVIDGATIRAESVDIKASTEVGTKWVYQTASGGKWIDDPTDLTALGRTLSLGASTGAEAAVGFLAGLLGVNIVHSQAVGTASVTVKNGSLIEARQNVTLRAENTTEAGAAPSTGLNGPGTQVNTPLGLGALYARTRADASVKVEGGASVRGRNLTVRAHNEATLEASVSAADAGSDSGSISIAVGVTNADVRSKAVVEQGAVLQVSGTVSVAATNKNAFGNTVEAQTGDNGKASAAVAVSEIVTKATAELATGVPDATRVEVIALNENTQNVTTANSKTGSTLNDMIIAGVQQKLEPVTDTSGAIENYFWDKLLGGESPDTKVKPISTPFRIGGALAWAKSSADALALIGPAVNVHATGDVMIAARTKATDVQIAAESAAVSQSRERAAANTARNTFSAGVAIGDYEHDALAKIGADAVVTAPRVGVSADVLIPVRESLITGGSFDRWDGLGTIKDWFNQLTGVFDIFNGASAAKSTSDNSNGAISLSGSASLLSFSNTARSVLDTNAKLNLSGNAAGDWTRQFEVVAADLGAATPVAQLLHEWTFAAPAHIRAARETTLLFHGGHFLPANSGGGSAGGKGLGMAYTQENLAGATEAIVREGATIQGVDESVAGAVAGSRSWSVTGTRRTGEARVTAEANDLLISIAAAGGYGSSFGLNGSASIVVVDNDTRALVDDEAVISADRFVATASDAPVDWSLAGGFNLSSSAGVGVGIAYNGVTGTTRAEVADNDTHAGELATRASQIAAAGSVGARNIEVEARTGGRAEAIAVTGAVSWSSNNNNTSGGGFFQSIQGKYQAIQDKLAHLVDLKPTSTSKGSGGSQGGTSARQSSSFGLSGAGSAAVNDTDFTTVALVDGAAVDQAGGAGPAALVVRGVNDTDIVTASGAAALTRANNSSQTGSAAITGSVAVNLVDSITQGIVRNSTVTGANDVTVQALAGGEQLSIAIGVAIDASNQQSKNNSLAATGSLSLSLVDNEATAKLENTGVTGEAGASGRDVEVTAYNRTFIGTGGGTLSVGGKSGAGGSVTYSDITNDVLAAVTGGSSVTQVDTVAVRAYNATEIGAGAAHGQVSNATNGNALGGAVVITEITNNTTAAIDGGSTVNANGRIAITARDQGADATLEEAIEPGSARENVVQGLDYCGRDAGGVGAAPTGNCITSVAGVVQVGRGNNIGLSFNWSDIRNNLTARVENATVESTGTAGLAIEADSNTAITSFAVGVGASDKVSGAGSVAVNRVDNAVLAAANGGAALTADTVTLDAKDRSRIDTLGGQVNIGKNAAVGAAVTYSEIGNEARAIADQASLSARAATSLLAENDSRIRALAVAGTAAVGSGAPAVSASISVNFIGNRTEASAVNTVFDDPAGGANTHAVVVRAEDKSGIESLAGSVAVGTSAGVGGAFAYNGIANTVLSSVGNSAVHRAGTIDLAARETAQITSLSVAAAGGQTLAISGSVSLNHIGNPDGADGNVVTAKLEDSTVDGASTAATVKAEDGSTIQSLAGNVSISLGGPAFGGAVADNAAHNSARASVSGSTLALASRLTVEGRNTTTIESLSAAGSGAATGAFAGSASSNRIANRTAASIADSAMTGSGADVTVNAIDGATIKSLAGALSIGASAAVGAAIAVNRIDNVTEAYVTGRKAGTSGLDVRDFVMRSDSTETIETTAVSGAASADVGVAGSFAVNLIGNETSARVGGGAWLESDRNAAVIAESDDRITTSAGALGVGITAAGIGASVVVNEIGGFTRAYIDGPDTRVAARGMAGTPGVTVASGALSGAVDLMDSLDGAFARPDIAAMRVTEQATGVIVNASATHHVQNVVVNVGAGLVGVSGVANVSVVGGETAAWIDQAQVNQGSNAGATAVAQNVQVKASDHAYANNFVGGMAGGAVGVGVTVDVTVFDRDTRARIDGSALIALGGLTIGAESSQGVATAVVGASGGIVGVAGAGSVVKFTSETEARLASGTAGVGSLDVDARHDSRMFLSGGAIAAGGVGVGATFDVGLDNSVTRAYIDGATVNTGGEVSVAAESMSEIRQWTVAGAAAGTVAAAGSASVALIGNTTQAWVSESSIGSAGARAGGLAVEAKDSVLVAQSAGGGAIGGFAGAGLAAGVTKLENTTSAYIDNSSVFVANDVLVTAQAERNLASTVATAGGGLAVGLGGSVGAVLVGTALSDTQSGDTNANRELNKDGGGTLAEVNTFTDSNALGSGNTTAPAGNGYASAGLTNAEIDALNATARLDTNGVVYNVAAQSAVAETFNPATQLTGKTAAVIGGSSMIDADRDVRVHASDKDRVNLLAGAISAGFASIGGSVAVVEVTNNVEAAILGTTRVVADSDASGSGRLDVAAEAGKLNPGERALRAKALQAGGGVVGLGAAVAVGSITNNVKATVGRGTQTTVAGGSGAGGNGNVTVRALDTTDVETEALGANAGLVAAGVVIDRATKSGGVVARLGNTNAPAAGAADTFVDLAGGALNVQAERSGLVRAKARAGAGGILSGSGADASATDTGAVQALVGNLVDVDSTGGTVNVSATATPQTSATALGINVGIYSAGASVAAANSAASVNATLGAGVDVTAANLNVTATRNVPAAGSRTAAADATGAVGGGFIGINATSADAASGGTVSAVVGEGGSLNLTGAAVISATNNSSQFAESSGVTVGGLLALGANVATASSGTSTQAAAGNMVRASGTAFTLSAEGTDTNQSESEAGTGGIIAGSAAAANTRSTSTTTATTGSGDDTRQIGVGTFTLSARHTTNFNGEVDSVSASLAGASGAYATHGVTSTVSADVGAGGRITANHVIVRAENLTRKDWLGASGDAADWNIRSGSGGVIDAPAGKSESHVTHDTAAGIGADARVHVLLPAAGAGTFNLDAYNEIVGRDKAKLDSGGAIAIAKASSLFHVDRANATASFGANSRVVSDVGDINAGARARVDLDTRSSADTYGLAGAPEGNAYSVYHGSNQAIVNTGALLRADDGGVRVAAGQSAAGEPSSISARSTVNLWNKTAFPISTDPDAQSNVVNNAAVRVLGGGRVEAAGDIALYADKGAVDATASGIGKDIYRESAGAIASGVSNLFGGGDVSFDITGGSTSVGGLAEVEVNGTALTGIHRTESLTLDYRLLTAPGCASPPCVVDGRVLWQLLPTATKGVTFSVAPAVGIAANIQKRIDKLRSLMSQYSTDTVAVAAYQSEIAFLQHKLVELGLAAYTGTTDSATGQPNINVGQWNNPSPREAAQQSILQYQAQVSGAVTAINASAAAVRDTAANAHAAGGVIVANAGTIDANAGTVATNNTGIQTTLATLANFSAANATYQQTYTNANSLVNTNATLRAEINSRAALNNTANATIGERRLEINALLGEIAATSVQSVIDARQAEIAAKAGEIDSLVSAVAARNAEIGARAAQIVANNTTIDANQAALVTAFRGGSGDDAKVGTINTLRTNNGTPRASIGTAATTIATQSALFAGASGYATAVATEHTAIDTAIGGKTGAQTQIADLTAQLPTLSTTPANGPIADFVTVNDITVRLGNIRVKGDRLAGGGELAAPGDARIDITNNTPDFLTVGNLSVASDEGGTIRLNGILVNDNAGINAINAGGSGAAFSRVLTRDSQGAGVAKPEINIASNYDPLSPLYANLPAPAPNIELNGNITNLRGSVTVRSRAGSILSNGSINAGTIDVKADNGDFVQSFVDNFFHVGGDPASIQDHGTPLGAGIVANGSVFISARYLNINSLVQSGIEQWNLALPAAPLLTGPASLYGVSQEAMNAALASYKNGGPASITFATTAGTVTYNAAMNRIEVPQGYADADRNTAGWATRTSGFGGLYPLVSDYGNIGVYYDPANVRYELNGTQVRGGYIQLFGQIMNTSAAAGAGKLRVLDGYGQIRVENPTGLPVVVNTLDAGSDPTGTGRGIAGRIDIMDVQSIDNSSNTSSVIHSVYTRDYNPSTGAASVKLLKEIGTLNADGSFTVGSTPVNGTDTSATDGRHTSYSPQADLRYVWTTGTDNSTVTYLHYVGSQWFGSSDLRGAPTGSIVSQSGPFTLSSYRLDDGTYLARRQTLGAQAGYGAHNTTNHFASSSVTRSDGTPTWVKTREWSECNWWTLCIAGEYHYNVTKTTPTKTITTKSVRADYPISIEFSGWDTGTVAVNSASDVILNGAIRNGAGTTTITAGIPGSSPAGVNPLPGVSTANRSIIQASDTALVTSRNLTLGASGNVGGAQGGNPVIPVQVDVRGGALNAAAGNGNVVVHQSTGALNVGTVVAAGDALSGRGRVFLSADGSIQAANPATSVIQGHLVDLASANGSIGSVVAPLRVFAGYSDNLAQRGAYGLKAQAQGDIGIEAGTWSGNAAGNLLVDTAVSTGGDVRLVAPGRIIDNNPTEQIDTRTWNELLDFWNSLALLAGPQNDAKRASAIDARENGETQNYRLYWQMRARQANPSAYDPSFRFVASQAERDALSAQGFDSAAIAQFEANRTAQYHALHAEVGAYTAAFSESFRYEVAPGSAEEAQILKGSTWSERELGISIAPGLLKNVTSTNPVVKSANAQGRNVTLNAGVAIGETQAPLVIPSNVDPSCASAQPCFTDAMKVALAAAERADLTITPTQITVEGRKPVNFAAPQGLSATVSPAAAGHPDAGMAFLASLGDGVLDTVQAPGETRIKVRGSIVNESGASPALQAGALVLEASNGGIGYLPPDGVNPAQSRPLRIDLGAAPGATLVARAAEHVDIIEAAGDMRVDTVFSRRNATLTAAGSILDASAGSGLNVLADSIFLTAQSGSIGAPGARLEVGVNPDGRIHASAATPGQGVHLNGPFIASFNIGSVVSGDAIGLAADVDMKIDGPVQGAGPIGIAAGGNLLITDGGTVHARTGGLLLTAGSLTMEGAAKIAIDVGTVDIVTSTADAVITDIVTGNPTQSAVTITSAGSVLDGDNLALGPDNLDITAASLGAKVTINAQNRIGGNPIDILAGGLDANAATGLVHIAVQGGVDIGSVRGANEVVLTATGDITGGAVTSTGSTATTSSTAGGVSLASVTGLTGAAVSGASSVAVGNLGSGGNVTARSAGGNVNVATAIAGGEARFSAPAGAIAIGDATAGGSVGASAAGGIQAGTIHAGTSVELAADTINATVIGGPGVVTGSVTGYNGGIASSVNLVLSGAGGFAFGSFYTAAGGVSIPVGNFSFTDGVIIDRATFVNPQTSVLVDQHDRSIQPFDIQIYTGGASFSFSLATNHVFTNAMSINASPYHEVLTPAGPAVTAVGEGYKALNDSAKPAPQEPREQEAGGEGPLVSYTGVPVALDE
ncbi:MAG: leukotoxin LktA family filamentous adhesin [Burkholderiales bacterium]|nr:leukotoxin LktA family filamentous adhesin [Burkholderiales bacterium]